ncbi:serine/threonine-protein kinase [Nocardioides sp. R-C-SC26]|uniref:serine/threonine-protein kinase n=1 Tax=Nocardioides sp. R-C-SC26 TaxID=2870414 RepID=UPI001E3DAE09|nr:serine/threonine-protein kinase [Nocardioides sp. R-C-SC26]
MPERIGRYTVRRRIGSGGFATVWLAYDEQLDGAVAIKVLAENWSDDHQVRARFAEEGRYLRRVESPHVVSVYDTGELTDGRPYLVMSFADQGTLAERLSTEPLSIAHAAEVLRQVGAGLQALHDAGVLHRDVKPANVLFRTAEAGSGLPVRVMLGDLGLGRSLDMSSRLTMVAGTPAFVAPEQAAGDSPGAAADQYSLGVLAYLLLTGRTPWTYASLMAAASPTEMPALGDDVPLAAQDAVRRALARDPRRRWASVTEFATVLGDALEAVGGPTTRADGSLLDSWVPLDPHLTHAGARPSPLPDPPPRSDDTGSGEEGRGSRRPRRPWSRRVVTAGGAIALVLGAAGGWAGLRIAESARVVSSDADGAGGVISVQVPEEWTVVADEPWTPDLGAVAVEGEYPALSVGVSDGWSAGRRDGVFLGILPLTDLPMRLPRHADCADRAAPVLAGSLADRTRTVVATACERNTVVIDRVARIDSGRVLWTQVRAPDRATAFDVVDSARFEPGS